MPNVAGQHPEQLIQLGDGKVLESGEQEMGDDQEQPDASEYADHLATRQPNALATHGSGMAEPE